MKKIILLTISIIILYIISIFAFPSVSSYIGETFGLTSFNDSVIDIKDKIDEFITDFDILGKYEETKSGALEIKQNVEEQIDETKEQIEKIQTSVEDTTNSISDTIDSVNELQENISNIIPSKTSSGGEQ